MLTWLLSFNLSEVRLKFNSCPSPNASRCVCSPAVGRWVVSSWAQVFSLCLGLTLFMPEGHQELQTTEFFIKVTSWRDVPCSCCFLPQCVPSSYITYPALTRRSLWEELFDPGPDRRTCAVESAWVCYEAWNTEVWFTWFEYRYLVTLYFTPSIRKEFINTDK